MNCKYCGAPPMFEKGDRVELNDHWRKAAGQDLKYPVGRKAIVKGPSPNIDMCVTVVFDGDKKSTSFHQSFLTKI